MENRRVTMFLTFKIFDDHKNISTNDEETHLESVMTRSLKRRLVTTARWLEAVAECAMSRLASSSWRMLEKRMATLLWLIVLCRESVLSEPGHWTVEGG